MGIFARNTVRNSIVFRATTNNTGKNGDKKQNTLPYPYNFKVVEVCLVGAQRTIYTVTENACIFFGFAKSRAFGGAPRSAIINCRLCLNSKRYSKSVRQSTRSHSRLLASRQETLNLPKRKTPLYGTFVFLEQVISIVVSILPPRSKPMI